MRRTHLGILFSLLFVCQLALSQSGTTEVYGTVKDDQSNPMAKVTVVFECTTISGIKSELTTDKKGEFYYPGLLYQGEPGEWKIYPVVEGYLVKHVKVESRDSRKELFTGVDKDLGVKQSHPPILAKPGGKVIIDFIMAPKSFFEQQIANANQGDASAKTVQLSSLDKARAFYDEGKFEESIEMYKKATAEEKKTDIFLEMSKVLAEQNKIDEAAGAIKSALAINPNLAMLHFSLANIMRRQGDLKGAQEEMKLELAISPDNPKVLEGMAGLYAEAGNDAEAESAYRKILEKSPDNVNAYIALGGIYSKMGDFVRSEQAYRKVIELNPKNADTIYYNVGVSIINKKDLASSDRINAMEAFKKALELNPNHAGAHLQIGYLLLGQGKFEDAKIHFKKFVELKPNAPEAADVKSILQSL